MKKSLIILVVVVAVLAVVVSIKNIIIGKAIEKGAEVVTGLKLDIGSINVGIIRTVVDIKNLRLFNPANFPDRTMIDMPEIYVHYDLPAIISGKIHLMEMRLALKEFIVVKNKNGELNLNALTNIKMGKRGKTKSQPSGKAPQIKIDLLKLSIGKVIYKDYSKGATPFVQEFNLNINESFTNVDDPYALANLIVVKALTNTAIANLANFDLQGLSGSVGESLASAQKLANTAVATAQNTVTQTQETAKATAKEAQETVKQAADVAKDLFKNPFGSGK